MKKLIIAAVALLSAVSLQSCIDGDNESHGTAIYNNLGTNAPTELYADQTLDSMFVMSYDSWEASVKATEGGEWLTITPTNCKVPVGYVVTQSVYLKMTPNTTGKIREAAVGINSSYPEYGTLMTYIYQYPWLNITAPVPTYSKKKGSNEVVATFATKLAAKDTYAVLGCATYAEATLKSDANWLIVNNEDQVLKPGSHGIKFVVDPNNTGAEREAHVTLTSNGVSNVITYTQAAK